MVLCPTWLPATRAADGAFETLRVDPYGRFPGHGVTYSGGCSYLISLNTVGPAERAASSDRVPFHMLVGGDCRPFPLSVIGGYWPPVPSSLGGLTGWRSLPATEVSRLLAEEDRFDQRYLELPSEAGLKPGTDIAPVVLPRVVASARVRGLPALVLEVAPYPAGGLHGGHYAIVWNQGVAGYVLSFHYERGSRGLPPRASDIRALVRAADDMRPAH